MKIIDAIKEIVRNSPEGLPVKGTAIIEGQNLLKKSKGANTGISLTFGFCSGGYVVNVVKNGLSSRPVVAVEYDIDEDTRISRPNLGVSGVWSGAASFGPVQDEVRATQIANDVGAILKASLPKQAV